MKKLIMLSAICILYANIANSQGCVIVRNISGFGQYNFADNSISTSDWFINVTSRYFKSYRDFRGITELNFPKDSTHSIQSFTTDITISRLLANGWSLTLSLPIS